MMLQYLVSNEEGWNVNPHEFERNLKEINSKVNRNYKLEDSIKIGRGTQVTTMKAYGVYEGESLVGRIDAAYRPGETIISLTGNRAEEVGQELLVNADFLIGKL